MQQRPPWMWISVGALALTLVCACVGTVLVAGSALFITQRAVAVSTPDSIYVPFPTEAATESATGTIAPTPVVVEPGVSPTASAGLPAQPTQVSSETLELLQDTLVPANDLREIAERVFGISDIPEVVSTTPADHPVGTVLPFYAGNVDTNENFQINARLIYRTENAYFFAEEGVLADENDVRIVMDAFQDEVYDLTREFFGTEWTPGVDGDPRVYILYARNLGFSVAAYYSSVDQYSQLAHEFSNEKEMFYVNADTMSLSDRDLVGTLAHEFQHMIHWYNDRNEETWMNEGSSVLAELLNGYSQGYVDAIFLSDPDLQVNTWSDGTPGSNSLPHYGAGFLFMAYFLERFGEDATKALIAHPENGLTAVDLTLAEIGAGQTAEEFFADWVVANYVGTTNVGDGRYAYDTVYPTVATVSGPTDVVSNCPQPTATTSVAQFGADYIEVNCSGSYTVAFNGSTAVQVVPTDAYSGEMLYWANRQDESDTTLTREFDLTGVTSATLRYRAWWQIETDWDYAYVMVSTDGGERWTILETPGGTASDPNGNSLGWGYTGDSGGSVATWVQETVDLSAYTGQVIQVRFEYVTDAAVNRPGFVVDDVEIPEIGYFTDFEAGDDGWVAEGFVRMDNVLPQRWVVQVIQGNTVTRVPIDGGVGSVSVTGPAVIVVSGATPFTTERALYEYTVAGP